MNIALAQTFLEIAAAGSFARAAETLSVTQTAVSSRIQALEAELGRPLFVRNKAGARLTPAGREFLPYATQLVQIWERGRQQVAKPPGHDAILALGGEFSLWNSLLLEWLMRLHRDRPNIALRTLVEAPDRLMDRLQSGSLDIAIVYAPYHRRDVEMTPLLDETLVAVSTRRNRRELTSDDYIYVDWGAAFAAQHDGAFPQLRESGMFVGLGPLALRYLLAVGGTGYFRKRAIQPYLERGRLHPVYEAPEFSYSIYAAHSKSADSQLVDWATAHLTTTAAEPVDDWL